MNKSYQYLDIDVNKKIHRRLRAVQGDAKSRYILVSLYNNSMPFDLSSCSVKIFGVKSDKKIFFNYANIIDTSKGQFEIELTSQALAVNGELQIQILVLGSNQERLTTCTFFIDVDRTIVDDNAIQSENEFTALTKGLADLAEYDIYKNNILKHDENLIKHENKLNEVSSQLAQNMNDIDIIKHSRYVLNIKNDDFDVKFNEALNICKNTGQEIFIPYGTYSTSSTFDIDYSANIVMDKGALLNVTQTFLNINYPYCNIELNGTINVKTACTVIKINKPTEIEDKCIIGGNYVLNLKADDYLPNAIGFHIDSSYWKNILKINTSKIGTPIYLTNTWANSNEFYGKLIGFDKAIHFNMTSMVQGNVFKMDFEQVLNHESYGVFFDKGGCAVRSNNFFINHWLDNSSGRYWCYYDEMYANSDNDSVVKAFDNKIEGETEGLLKININSNFMQSLFFTRRDRSLIVNDKSGTHNNPLFTNLYPANIIKADISHFNSIENIGFLLVNENINCSLVYDEESYANVICIEYLNDKGGYVYKNLFYNDVSCRGKIYTLSADIKLPHTNSSNKYRIGIQDGISNNISSSNVECNDVWTRVSVSLKISDDAQLVQLNLGRISPGEKYVAGDKIYIKNIMVNEGYYRNAYYTPCYEENFVYCTKLPTPSLALRGKIMLLNGECAYICLKDSVGNYIWKKMTLE